MSTFTRDSSGYVLPSFPFVEPLELKDGTRRRYSEVIVGGGVAGPTGACDFANRGIDVVLVEEDDTVGVRGASRAIVYAQKSLEIFERLGVYRRLLEKGVTRSVGRTLTDDNVVYQFDASQTSLSAQVPFVNLQQFYVEWFLVDRIMEFGHVRGTASRRECPRE